MKRYLLFMPVLMLVAFSASAQSAISTNHAPPDLNIHRIAVDLNVTKGRRSEVFRECVGAGRASEGLRADWQRQLKMVQRDIGFKYIRFHGLLDDEMGVYTEDKNGNPVYNYQYIDELYDFLLSVKIKPFVELSFMPAALASSDKSVFWYKANASPPKSYSKWGDLIRNLVQHFDQRYGRAEVKTWYIEVWNEPDHPSFFGGTLDDYFHLYDVTAKEIKSVCPDYRVGGPASAKPFAEVDFVKHCADNHIPVDFVSTHCYGVKGGFFNEGKDKGVSLDQDYNSVTGRILHSRELLDKSQLPKLELHFTEWNMSFLYHDPILDSYHATAYILSKIKGVEGRVNSMSYWVFTDIFEEHGPQPTPFHGGFGMLNYQDIKKPSYLAYQFLNQLSATELINKDNSSHVCTDGKGNIQALLWDFTITHPGDSVSDQVYYTRYLPSKKIADAQVSITHVKNGKYVLQIFKEGYRINDPYDMYKDLGSPGQLTKEQVRNIKKASDGQPMSSETIVIKNGKFEKTLPMRQNDVYLVKLIKQKG